jgi:hypothetical protein
MTLYFAYGSNLNKRQMERRSPTAVALGKYVLDDAKLVFRGVADVIAETGSKVQGGIWKIMPDDEAALDRYEGYRSDDPDGSMYRKVYLPLAEPINGETELMLYVMNSEGIYPPSEGYLDTIIDGYRDFGLPMKALRDAVKHSWDEKAPSHIERRRYRKAGRPQLGLSEMVPLKKRSEPVADKPKAKPTKGKATARKAMIVYGD